MYLIILLEYYNYISLIKYNLNTLSLNNILELILFIIHLPLTNIAS